MSKKYLSQEKYCEDYMRYLGIAKTARRSYAESVRLLKAKGFREISSFKTLKAGDKVYRGYEDRTGMAAVIGKRKIAEAGLKVVGGHTDAPRLDLKPKPLYEKGGCVYFDCHMYGGIKKYQWLRCRSRCTGRLSARTARRFSSPSATTTAIPSS